MERIIDIDTWERKAPFLYYSAFSSPFYTIVLQFNVTRLVDYCREHKLSFYFCFIFLATKAMESVDIFRYRIRGKEVIVTDTLYPYYTDLIPGNPIYVNRTLTTGTDIADFCRRATALRSNPCSFMPQPEYPLDYGVFFSSVPTLKASFVSNPPNPDPDYSIPHLNWASYVAQGDSLTLSVTLEVNHRLIYGQDLAQFQTALQERISAL